ncbi:MAG: hypothetical protein OEL83_15905 [Desulforhopalus sp.]|nr:hypothetical protein [Desulforhopalus sp.]
MRQLAFKRRGLNARLVAWFDKLGPCGNVGLMIGIMAGGLLTLLSVRSPHLTPTPPEVFWIFVILALFCWMMMVGIATIFLRLQFQSVVLGMLMRSLVICLFTVLIAHLSGAYHLGIIIGVLVGLFFGYVLCTILERVRG